MQDYVVRFNEKLIGLFERKAEEFDQRSDENPAVAKVASELAGLYKDLANLMKV
jgi:hypothetical protein